LEAPIPAPADQGQGDPLKFYHWDEETQSWIENTYSNPPV